MVTGINTGIKVTRDGDGGYFHLTSHWGISRQRLNPFGSYACPISIEDTRMEKNGKASAYFCLIFMRNQSAG